MQEDHNKAEPSQYIPLPCIKYAIVAILYFQPGIQSYVENYCSEMCLNFRLNTLVIQQFFRFKNI